jgi:hypothetical protein
VNSIEARPDDSYQVAGRRKHSWEAAFSAEGNRDQTVSQGDLGWVIYRRWVKVHEAIVFVCVPAPSQMCIVAKWMGVDSIGENIGDHKRDLG